LPCPRSFPSGFEAAGATADTVDNIRWGADYLLKTVNNGAANSDIVYQVGPPAIWLRDCKLIDTYSRRIRNPPPPPIPSKADLVWRKGRKQSVLRLCEGGSKV